MAKRTNSGYNERAMKTPDHIVTTKSGKTDFEKLCICIQYVKSLKFQIGVLQSEIDELKHDNAALKKVLNDGPQLTSEEKMEIKRGEYYASMKHQMNRQRARIGTLRKSNGELLSKLLKAKGMFDNH